MATANDALTVSGVSGDDAFALTATASGGTLTSTAAPTVVFTNFGTGSDVAINGGGGEDSFEIQYADDWLWTRVSNRIAITPMHTYHTQAFVTPHNPVPVPRHYHDDCS